MLNLSRNEEGKSGYLITLYFLRICSVLSIGNASTVRPWPVVVFALNSELYMASSVASIA